MCCMIMTKNCGPICTGVERRKILRMMAHHLRKSGRDQGKIQIPESPGAGNDDPEDEDKIIQV